MIRKILNLKVIVGALATAAVLLAVTVLYILIARPAGRTTLEPASAALTLLPAPTSTRRYVSPTPTFPPTRTLTRTPAPGEIIIGSYVQVRGTGSEGLSIRATPGLSSETSFIGDESEVFHVIEGPEQADGHTWWLLSTPYDRTRSGWAVQDYLLIIDYP